MAVNNVSIMGTQEGDNVMGMFKTDKGQDAVVAKSYERHSINGNKFNSIEAYIQLDELESYVAQAKASGSTVLKIRQTPYSKQDGDRIFNEFSHFVGKPQKTVS